MRRIPSYMVLALTGLLLVLASVASIMSVDAQYPADHPIVLTGLAMLTKMPAEAAATQMASMGYKIPPEIEATGRALLKTLPKQAVLETLMAQWLFKRPGPGPTSVPPNPPGGATPIPPQPGQPTPVPPQPGQPTPIPPQPGQPTPVPLPVNQTATPGSVPTVLPSATRIPGGRISGNVLRTIGEPGRIDLRLYRPNNTTLTIPTGAGGAFVFSGMEPGTYTLEAASTGLLSSQITFILAPGQDLTLPLVYLQVGDTNSDNQIDLADAALIAANFDTQAAVPLIDINGDGWVNILDLTLVGHAYGLVGPLPWGEAPA